VILDAAVRFLCFLCNELRLFRLHLRMRRAFPRLYQLYLASTQHDPDNYFERPNLLIAIEHGDDQLQAIENDLQRMDEKAWQFLKTGTAPLVTRPDRWGYYARLFDHFDEARGYCYLKEQGYSSIEFVPRIEGVETPDLWGHRADGGILLEVKMVHESNEEKSYLEQQEKDARKVEHALSEALKRKLKSTVSKAADQLRYPGRKANRRLLLLSVRIDTKSATTRTHEELNQFLETIRPSDVEIVHSLKNAFLL